MKRFILPCVVAAAILFFLFFFVFEGFQVLPVYEQKNMETKCAAYKSCGKCLADKDCGWASDYAEGVKGLVGVADDTIIACIPQSGGKPFITSNLSILMLIKNGARTLTNFVSRPGQCTDVKCEDQKKCSDCVPYDKCAWQQVTGADGNITQSCINKADAGAANPSKNTITSVTNCPIPQCSDMTDCRSCANITGCSFCTISGKCLKNSEFGSGVNQCSTDNKVSLPSNCPCGAYTKCDECAAQAGCAFCKESQKCVNLDRYGMPPAGTCTASSAATSAEQCTSGKPAFATMANTRLTADEMNAMASSLDAAGDSGNLVGTPAMPVQTNTVRPDSGQPVSAAKNYPMVTPPRPLGASSMPATVRHEADGGSPLENYVKMLVNSQLAAQGVPTNEPFQVNETAALANASDYMRKVFRGVVG
jgi:hypothetical protein